MTTPTRTEIITSLVLMGSAFVAGAIVALAAVAVAYGAIRGCGA